MYRRAHVQGSDAVNHIAVFSKMIHFGVQGERGNAMIVNL